MRNSIGFIALSLLAAAAVAGCSSESDPTGKTASKTTTGGYDPGLTGELAKYNSAIVPLKNACSWTAGTGKISYLLASNEILILSLRAVDLALLANGKECTYTDSKTGVVLPVTNTLIKSLDVIGADASASPASTADATAETAIFDVRNGLFALGAITVDLKGNSTGGGAGDEVAVLGTTGADKVTCVYVTATTSDGIDLNSDKTVDIKPTKPASGAANHFTFDLNSGADTFDQGACITKLSVYGGMGADTITVGSLTTTVGDIFSGGTDATATEPVDTITFAARTTNGVTVALDTSVAVPGLASAANDGDGDGTVEKDNVLNDFEVVTGTGLNDFLTSGVLRVGVAGDKPTAYVLNGMAGDDVLASKQNFGTIFNGGTGVDTVDYSARTAGIVVTMDGKTADDGEKDVTANVLTNATLDNVAADVENLFGTDAAGGDKITGNSANNVIRPGAGPDVVVTLDGDDYMLSGGAAGGDVADGDDLFQGGTGNDTVDYANRISNTTKGVTINLDATFSAATVAGTKVLGTASGISGEADYIGLDVENAVGTIGTDVINGSAVPNSIWSMGGTDTIVSGAGSDVVDANVYTGTLLTANGYRCTNALTCADSAGAALSPQPANCDCNYTAAGYKCDATKKCIDPATGVAYVSQPGACDCGSIGSGAALAATTCDTARGVPVSSLVRFNSWATCVAGTYNTGTCTTVAAGAISCGNDSLDIASCAGAASTVFTGCWKTQ
jgi:hypothetical protein